MRSAIIIAALIILFVSFAQVITPEDNWICSKGDWVKHGNPTIPRPTGSCR